ncbi:MAG: endonuclease MutS2 [Dehalococcoidia bacterium]|nr:endonuclease MutS2 [Dehalococcoidia bacterium]
MDEKSLEMLEFPRIREIMAGYASFSASRELALGLQPGSSYEEVERLLGQVTEARSLLAVHPGIDAAGAHDIREEVAVAARGGVLDTAVLLQTGESLRVFQRLRAAVMEMMSAVPLLWGIAGGIAGIPRLEGEIARCIGPQGEVLDTASPKLADLRRREKDARQRLLEHLHSLMNSSRWKKVIQEPVVSQREGRYVLLVKNEFKKAMKGIIHDTSNTGATVYLEPWSSVEMGNDLRECILEKEREVERILTKLSAEVGQHEDEISYTIELVAEMDLILAKARYARDMDASEPFLVRRGESMDGSDEVRAGRLKLVEARHPLLGKKAVPLSLEMARDFPIIVITGPNTGGKTVALKTVGLLSLMAQAGIPIPASGESCLPVFDDIFSDIGDDQSIEQTLSTFSWHMGNIVRLVKHATARSLVLLDELGTGTDPLEGSALARSLLGYFLMRKTMVIATTHFSDLKIFAHENEGLRNASFAFDPVTLEPSYHLVVGVPGGSNALATASRLGLPDEIVSGARDLLSKGEQDLGDLITSMMAEKEKAEALRRALEESLVEAERSKMELKSEVQRLRTEEKNFLQDARDEVISEAARLQKEIRQAAVELRRERTRRQVEKAGKTLQVVEDHLKEDVWQAKVEEAKLEAELEEGESIGVGDRVRLKSSDVEATVLSLSQRQEKVEVQVGQTRIWMGLDSVRKVESSSQEPLFRGVSLKRKRPVQATLLELDLRGKRAEEVEISIDSYLNDAFLSNLSEVRIVHGFGMGVVRQISRDFLASHSLVKSFRPGEKDEGGDGVTVVTL